MKHIFYLTLLMTAIALVAAAGWRGMNSRQPQIELFPDMVRQPKVRPQGSSGFFANRTGSRQTPPGTVPQASPHAQPIPGIDTGRETHSTNWLAVNPLPLTAPFLSRGQDRYRIFCSPCHGISGDGHGITIKYNMVAMANFHDKRLIDMPDGQLYDTITHGKNLMGAYGSVIAAEDRWAIIGYIRALERSRLATLDDVPPEIRPAYGK